MKTRGSGYLKKLDRYVGIPLVALVGLRPRRERPSTVRRIGLMKSAAIGDTALLAGLVDDVKRTFADAELVLITGLDNAGVVPLLGASIDRAIMVSPSNFARSVLSLRALDLDVLVDLGAWPRFDALLAALSGARFTVGFRTDGQLRHYAYDAVVEHSRAVHERANYERLLNAIGVVPRTPPHIVAPSQLGDDRLPREPFAIFHPWSSGYRHEVKEWPDERWVSLGQSIGLSVVVTGGRHESVRTASLVGQMHRVGVQATDLSGRLTLAELTDLLAAGQVVVSVNTGVAHLAGLVGARTVSLEGPTPPLRWAPLGPRVRTVTTKYPNCGYLNLGFEYAGQRVDCMEGISVDAVMDAVAELLSGGS